MIVVKFEFEDGDTCHFAATSAEAAIKEWFELQSIWPIKHEVVPEALWSSIYVDFIEDEGIDPFTMTIAELMTNKTTPEMLCASWID